MPSSRKLKPIPTLPCPAGLAISGLFNNLLRSFTLQILVKIKHTSRFPGPLRLCAFLTPVAPYFGWFIWKMSCCSSQPPCRQPVINTRSADLNIQWKMTLLKYSCRVLYKWNFARWVQLWQRHDHIRGFCWSRLLLMFIISGESRSKDVVTRSWIMKSTWKFMKLVFWHSPPIWYDSIQSQSNSLSSLSKMLSFVARLLMWIALDCTCDVMLTSCTLFGHVSVPSKACTSFAALHFTSFIMYYTSFCHVNDNN